MGIGYALSEELVIEQGHVVNGDLRKYKLPRSLDIPEVVPILVEAHSADGPFGAKGVGEITSIPTAPAITNAIYARWSANHRAAATPGQVLEKGQEARSNL